MPSRSEDFKYADLRCVRACLTHFVLQKALATDYSLLEIGHHSDAIIQCGDETFKVQKAILCPRSEWFKKALNGPFMETASAIATIQEIKPKQVIWLLKYLYGQGYSLDDDSVWSRNIFIASAEAYEVADFLLLKSPKKTIAHRLMTEVSELIAMLQKTPFCKETLQDECLGLCGKFATELIRVFLAGVHLVYSARYDNNYLQEVYIEFGVRYSLALLQYPKYVEGLRREMSSVLTYSSQLGTAIAYLKRGNGLVYAWNSKSAFLRMTSI